MITHRFATHNPLLPPVRAYKWIALSFLGLTAVLFAVIVFMLTKKTTITVVAKEDLKNVVLAVKVTPSAFNGVSIAGTVTTTKYFFQQTFHPTGTKTVPGVAKGKVILYNKTSADQALVKTTRLMSAKNVLFRLTDHVVVPANGQVTAAVYSDQAGETGDILPSTFTIPGLNEAKQKVIYAESKEAMSGGLSRVGALSAKDIASAKDQYKALAGDAYLKSTSGMLGTSLKHLVKVTVGDVISNHQSEEEVSEFTLSGTSTVAVVSYDDKDLQTLLQDAVDSKIDAESEKVLSLDKEPKVTLDSFDAEKGTADLAVTQNLVVTIDANGSALAARNFMGKRKDDIERYLMGLDHVYAVDVQFSPSWISTAPSVSDRIKVIVKSVK